MIGARHCRAFSFNTAPKARSKPRRIVAGAAVVKLDDFFGLIFPVTVTIKAWAYSDTAGNAFVMYCDGIEIPFNYQNVIIKQTN